MVKYLQLDLFERKAQVEIKNSSHKATNRLIYTFCFSVAVHTVAFLYISRLDYYLVDKKKSSIKINPQRKWEVIYLPESHLSQHKKTTVEPQKEVPPPNKETPQRIVNDQKPIITSLSKTQDLPHKEIVHLKKPSIEQAFSLSNNNDIISNLNKHKFGTIEHSPKKSNNLTPTTHVNEPTVNSGVSSYKTVFGEEIIQKGDICFTLKDNPMKRNSRILSLPAKCPGAKNSSEKFTMRLKQSMRKYQRQQK